MRNEISSFVIADPTKCVGCRTCELACFTVTIQRMKQATL